jgi:hypothetical protein
MGASIIKQAMDTVSQQTTPQTMAVKIDLGPTNKLTDGVHIIACDESQHWKPSGTFGDDTWAVYVSDQLLDMCHKCAPASPGSVQPCHVPCPTQRTHAIGLWALCSSRSLRVLVRAKHHQHLHRLHVPVSCPVHRRRSIRIRSSTVTATSQTPLEVLSVWWQCTSALLDCRAVGVTPQLTLPEKTSERHGAGVRQGDGIGGAGGDPGQQEEAVTGEEAS